MNSAKILAGYHDGQTARQRVATVQIGAEGLVVHADDGSTVLWPFETVSRQRGPDRKVLRLASEDHPGARLTVEDPEDVRRLLEAMPGYGRPRANPLARKRAMKWTAGLVGGLALATLFVLEGMPRLFAYLPMSAMTGVGDNVERQVMGVFGGNACDAPAATAALVQLKDRLLADVEPTSRFDPALVRIRLTSHAIPNALAAPGGRLIVFAGLFDLLDDDWRKGGDELAAVIAHEIAHARERHPTKAAGRQIGVGLLGQFIAGGGAIDAGGIVASLAYTRAAEREADEGAREMLANAGIGDAGLTSFFRRLQNMDGEDGGGGLPAIFSSHPPHAERAAAGPGRQGPNPAFSEAEWNALRSAAEKCSDS